MTDDNHNGNGDPGSAEKGRRAKAPLDSLLADSCERDLLVKRYLLGYLTEDEVEAFEERFIHDQGLLDEIDEAERFIDGFRGLAAEGRLDDPFEPPRRPFIDVTRGGGFSLAFRVACAGAVVIAVLVAAVQYRELRGVQRELAQVQAPQVNPQIVDLEVTRAAPAAGLPARAVRLPAQPGWIVLAMDTGSTATGERKARLLDSTDRVVAESTGLQPDDLGVVYWAIHSSMLREGDYVAQVGAASPSSVPDVRYLFRVMARG